MNPQYRVGAAAPAADLDLEVSEEIPVIFSWSNAVVTICSMHEGATEARSAMLLCPEWSALRPGTELQQVGSKLLNRQEFCLIYRCTNYFSTIFYKNK